jgi:glycosyltransferase involved in cell wall biosynthesis
LLLRNNIKINIEIPTYPFSGEGQLSRLTSFINATVEKNYKRTINSITYMGTPTTKIWGIPAIKFENGICVEQYKLLTKNRLDNCLNIIGVGSLDFWHGYDRAIEGIAKSSNNIMLHIVGDGNELKPLKELAISLGVEKKVVFYGKLHSQKLDAVFDICHLAIDSLGRHRSGNNYNSSIKSKEYAARGLPFIQSHIDQSFSEAKFVLKVPTDEQAINFDDVFYWYQEVNILPADIRKFAINNLQWEMQFKKLLQ